MHLITLPKFCFLPRAKIATFIALTTTLAGLSLSNSYGRTLAPLPDSCFRYSAQEEVGKGSSLSVKKFHAELVGTGYEINVATSALSDPKRKLDKDALIRINAAAAYGVLVSYHHELPAACGNSNIPEIEEVKGSLPEATWQNIEIIRPDRKLFVRSFHVKLISTSPLIRAQFEAKGLDGRAYPLFPQNASGDVSLVPSTTLPFNFTINNFHTSIGVSEIDGHGTVHAAKDLPNSTANIHLSISKIGKLIDELSRAAPVKVTAAFLVARLLGDREPNHRTGWNVELSNAKVKVNGKVMPINLQQH
ncbi:hypothetical protein GT348_04895 [Aristophania vespae]|uniref:DUF2125 domain-containing protein n=1 Tax=Aristophania vespae TaxID=2697033 RepID=A0A6P1NAJ9_9PROT|nr:hypothetical protein [Aristophania vespae]QHI95685.1 hypothetical protein GT348_04895 [Aristophania vespae]